MTLLLTASQLAARRPVARNELSQLTVGLRAELEPFLQGNPAPPQDKALLSKVGGRCDIDGALLRFDPYDPRHTCPDCDREFAGELHDRFRLYWYQLWLAERAVHAAMLAALLNDDLCRNAAVTLLDRYVIQYPQYPNVDNVLGPSRPFFSTYLESIWLLQIAIAIDLLEMDSASDQVLALGAEVRNHIIRPSAALIASYDEGMSNRQVWNNAAMLCAARLLDDRAMFDRATYGPSGFHAQLRNALLSDGSWYEGENYHLFAHRGLWYCAQLCATAGQQMPDDLSYRMDEGFAAPFRSVLPDMTYPSRRDSQYKVSIRQPRFAELCELGLAHHDDERLTSILARLYNPAIPRGETGRAASSADVERNLPPTGLRRGDLSWRTLLFARPTLPPLTDSPFTSDLMPAQGLGIIRRNGGELYASLDYGVSGGGHGHPDRLNLTLMSGEQRWFDDPGTGSYVDRSLHWYRSTLAHNAPLVDGHSQARVDGTLLVFEDDGEVGRVSARARLGPGVDVRRTLLVTDRYLIDELDWTSSEEHEISLPMHGVQDRMAAPRLPATLGGGEGLEDGFDFLRGVEAVAMASDCIELVSVGGQALHGWLFAGSNAELFSANAPGPPGRNAYESMTIVRSCQKNGRFVVLWDWSQSVSSVRVESDGLVVEHADGSTKRHVLSAHATAVADAVQMSTEPRGKTNAPLVALPAIFQLGEANYRRSEYTWRDAGAPTATVSITRRSLRSVAIAVDVPVSDRLFVPLTVQNQLDNEPASINGDSIQLYAISGRHSAGWLLVPEANDVGMRAIDGWHNSLAVEARWRPSAAGYRLEAIVHVEPSSSEIAIDVLINDATHGRARRRGQLVLSGARGEFVYLRGDRHDPHRLIRFSLPNV